MERELCKCLCKAVKKPSDEGMRAEIANISRSMGVDLKAKKAWISSNGRKGFPAIAVEFASKFPPNLHVKSVLIIVFRSTTGLAEWLEYLVRFNKVPRDGDNKNGTLKILKVWKRALDEVRTRVQSIPRTPTLRATFSRTRATQGPLSLRSWSS